MWYNYSLIALLGLFTTASAQAQPPYYPPARSYPHRHVRYPSAPVGRYDPFSGGYNQQLPQQDPRQVWAYPGDTGGTFQHTSGNQWVQYRNRQSPFYYVEVGRTPEYVELLDQQRNLGVRLYPDRLWQSDAGGDWFPNFEGRWVR
jgi:hypothetical protein